MIMGRHQSAERHETDRLSGLLALHEVALDSMAHGLCVFDSDFCIAMFHRRYLEMFDFSPDVIRPGVPYLTMLEHSTERGNIPPDEFDEFWRERRARLRAGLPFSVRRPLPNGGTVSMRYEPLPGGGWVSVYEDVTAQHRLESELRVQIERLDRAMSNMSHGLCLFGPDERLIMCNAQYRRIYGLDAGVVKPGISYRDILAHGVELGNHGDLSVDELYARRIEIVRRREEVTQQLHMKDGRVIETTVRPVADGGWVADHEDITVRLRYEDTLREQHILFDAALNNMSQGLCMFGADQRLIVCNEQYCKIFESDRRFIKPGIGLREIFADGVRRGLYNETVDELIERRLALLADQRPVV